MHVRVKYTHASAPAGQSSRQLEGHRRFTHAALAGRDAYDSPYLGRGHGALLQHDVVGPFSPNDCSALHNVVAYTQLNTAALNNSNECAFKLRVPQKTSLYFGT